MQLSHALLSFLFAFSLVAASPVDRVKLEKLKRQDEGNVIYVTVTDVYTVTVSSTVPQSTTTVIVAPVGDASASAAPVATDTPVPAVQLPTTSTTSPDPPAATTPSTNSDATSSEGSSSAGSLYTGQGTFYGTG